MRVRISSRGMGVLVSAVLATACGVKPTPAAPTSNAPPAPLPPANLNWVGDAVVTSVDGGGACFWGTKLGETPQGILWDVRFNATGNGVWMNEDSPNFLADSFVFSGPTHGDDFSADVVYLDPATEPSRAGCDFREVDLAGHFSPDRSHFDADETLIFGPPSARTTIVRHWSIQKP